MKRTVLSIVFFLLLTVSGIAQNTATSKSNSTMEQLLKTLDNHLKTARPKYYASLNAPLTEPEINELENKFKVKLPNDLKMLYKWKNGQNNKCFEALINNGMFTPLQQVLASAADLNEMIGFDFDIKNWWNKSWLPLFSTGGGDEICYDMAGIFTNQPGQIIEFWHETPDRNVIAPSFESFIAAINRYYETTPPSAFDEFFILKQDIKGYPKRFEAKGKL
jgi:cell wall assembly regulator SMI1